MVKTTAFFAAAACFAAVAGEELKVSADSIKADRKTGAMCAEGNVTASLPPLSLRSVKVSKSPDGLYEFGHPTEVTTCTNAPGHRHWVARGRVEYRNGEYVKLTDGSLLAMEWPVMWLPFWYYPIDTDYGWRLMPGYSRRNGAGLFAKYVYGIAGSMSPGEYGLGGATRIDARYKNGVAGGQSVSWRLGDWGLGKIKAYYADDLDHDRYDRRWSTPRHWNYRNWGSTVDRERWAAMFEHRMEIGERDTVRASVAAYSDSHMERDFLQDSVFRGGNRFTARDNRNEAAWEHLERHFLTQLSVTGPIESFMGGVARLPEFGVLAVPQPVFGTPVNYEGSAKVGYYDRRNARYGDSTTDPVFRYAPGVWAEYNTFRFDTYHRLTLPFKLADVLSVVPRVGWHGTYWGESGYYAPTGYERAGTTGDGAWRGIFEGGVTFAARGAADVNDRWRHIVEPYLDVLAQEAQYYGLAAGARPYVFDYIDASREYLDQFAGRSRNLPYSWYGLTPGLRNAFRKTDADGESRTVIDLDVYSAIQLNDTHYTRDSGKWQRQVRNVEDPHYGKHGACVMPGARLAWNPTKKTTLSARGEWDGENAVLAYSDVSFVHHATDSFSWHVNYNGRDHRVWDYSVMPYDAELMRKDMFNHARQKFGEVGFEYDVCDALAFSPFVVWDFDEGELSEVGTWVDLRTDCLGFRFSFTYEEEYERVDRSIDKDDFRFGFFVYLRALGPTSGNPFR